jgi:hypothetical protein
MTKYVHLDVSFFYDASILMPRARNPVEQNMRGTVAVGIKKVDPAEMPVALRVEMEGLSKLATNMPMVDWRWDGEYVYEKLHDFNHLKDEAVFPTVERISEMARNGSNDRLNPFSTVAGRKWGAAMPPFPGEVGFRTAISNIEVIEDEIMQQIRTIAASMRVIDGHVYRRRPEPLLTLRGGFGGFEANVDIISGGRGAFDWGRTYRLDELDRVLKNGGADSEREDNKRLESRFEVVVPLALTSNPAKAGLVSQITHLLNSMFKEIGNCPLDLVTAFVHLRDELQTNHDIPGNIYNNGNSRISWVKHDNEFMSKWLSDLAYNTSLSALPVSLLEKIHEYGVIAKKHKAGCHHMVPEILELMERYETIRDANRQTLSAGRRY